MKWQAGGQLLEMNELVIDGGSDQDMILILI